MQFRNLFFLSVFLVTGILYAQSPQKFNYQAVARNATGNPLAGTSISLRLSITDGSTPFYTETFLATTNALGLFNVEVGNGTVVSGTFNTIDWLGGPRHLLVEMDATGGSSYTIMGSQQLLSVPYALVADKVNMPLEGLNNVSDAAPVTNQVLQWNGTEWVPANISVGSGDNWGSQSALTNVTLTGNGTSAFPLGIASQGASTGQVLQWNGGAWVPAYISGDNWGSSVVNTNTQFSGNGTPANPLVLASQGAIAGQVLRWNGISWVPDDDTGLNLPYTGSFSVAPDVLNITNTGGDAIVGKNLSSLNYVAGLRGTIQLATGGVDAAGVVGQNNSTNSNGYGVWGYHMGSGAGVKGEAAGSNAKGVYGVAGNNGYGLYGEASATTGIGAYGTGSVGIMGNTATSAGRAIYGIAPTNAYAGYFDGKMLISYNSYPDPSLLIRETENTDYARIRFENNNPGRFWEINVKNDPVTTNEFFNIWSSASGNILSLRADGNLGLGVINPTQRLDVAGAVKFSGALMPNNQAGTSGQVLVSGGPGTPPVWGSSTNTLYNNTYLWDQSLDLTLTTSDQALTYNGLVDLPFTVSTPSKVIVHFSSGRVSNAGNVGGGNSIVVFKVVLRNSAGTIINQGWTFETIVNGGQSSFNYTHHCLMSPGSYKVNIVAYVYSGDTDIYVSDNFFFPVAGQVSLQVVGQ